MIDTIKGNIDISEYKYEDINHLIHPNSITSLRGEYYTVATTLSNFNITINLDLDYNPIRLKFTGSLPKFYFRNNLAQLDWESTAKAIEELSYNLNVDIREATLTRIDFGINFILKHPIHRYTSCFVRYKHLEPYRRNETIKFYSKNGSKDLDFYDKIKEMHKKRQKKTLKSIPDIYHNRNILRYEIQLKSRLKESLELDSVKVKDLYNDTHQKKIVSLWFEGYEKVVKFIREIDPIYLLTQYNGLIKYLAYHGIERLGYDTIINNISYLIFDVKNPSVKISKMKATLNELLREVKENTLEENLVAEMDNKMEFIKKLIS